MGNDDPGFYEGRGSDEYSLRELELRHQGFVVWLSKQHGNERRAVDDHIPFSP
jgi:hypothetical protein